MIIPGEAAFPFFLQQFFLPLNDGFFQGGVGFHSEGFFLRIGRLQRKCLPKNLNVPLFSFVEIIPFFKATLIKS
jgi:hypothetical protein